MPSVSNNIDIQLSKFTTGNMESRSDHLEPPHVEEELKQSEEWDVQIDVVAWVLLTGIQELAAERAPQEERVHRQRGHLFTWK